MKLPEKKPAVGYWVRVAFVDVGCLDGLVIDKTSNSFKIFFPYDNTVSSVVRNQIVMVGTRITANPTQTKLL